MVRSVRRSRPEQPTLIFRLFFAGAFLAVSAGELGNTDPFPSHLVASVTVLTPDVDPIVVGSIPTIAARARKGDLLAVNKPAFAVESGKPHAPGVYAANAVAIPRLALVVRPPPVPVRAFAEAVIPAPVPVVMKVVPKPKPIVAAVATAEPPAKKPVLLTYAPAKDIEGETAPFDAVIAAPKGKAMGKLLVPGVDYKHAWVNDPLPVSVKKESEIKCLANAIYFEARGEPEKGRLAVAQVVLNRVKNPAYPDTICNVVYQNKNKRNRCQFSFACDGIRDRISNAAAWNSALAMARKVVADESLVFNAEVGPATHYHATYVRPRWAKKMKKMDKIGRHIFYKTYNGGWS